MELCQQLYKGFTETMANSEIKDRYEIVVEGTADWAADKAITMAEDWMQSNSEINCFVTQSDTLTVGVCEALRASGKSFDGVGLVPDLETDDSGVNIYLVPYGQDPTYSAAEKLLEG